MRSTGTRFADGVQRGIASDAVPSGGGADLVELPGAVWRGARSLCDRSRRHSRSGRARGGRRVACAVRASGMARPLRARDEAGAGRRRDVSGAGLCSDARAGDDHGRGRTHLRARTGCSSQAGELLRQPGLEKVLALLRAEGAASAYTGSLAQGILSLMRRRGGPRHRRTISPRTKPCGASRSKSTTRARACSRAAASHSCQTFCRDYLGWPT